jgi:dTDP-4-amino-4,6-dideoxygalactose transaminase
MLNPHQVTKDFEQAIADYTGAPYCVCVDNQSNALFMALIYMGVNGKKITIPSNTYPSVANEIINAGGKVKFDKNHPNLRNLNKKEKKHFIKAFPKTNIKKIKILTGEYRLKHTSIWDSSLMFTANMFRPGQFQCLSFTGQWKILKTIKGGAILTDSKEAYNWFKRFRFSGRRECSYFDDDFDFIGKNYYMPHVFASIGLQMIQGFYNLDGTKKTIKAVSLPYPDLSKHKCFTNPKKYDKGLYKG